jgi:hypothetical protein
MAHALWHCRTCLGVGLMGLCVVLAGCRKPPPVPVPVKGRVQGPPGQSVNGLLLTFYPDDESNKKGRLLSKVLDEEGRFEGECLPGRYKVTLAPVPIHVGGDPAGAGAGKPGRGTPGPAKAEGLKHSWKDITIPPGGTDSLVLKVR